MARSPDVLQVVSPKDLLQTPISRRGLLVAGGLGGLRLVTGCSSGSERAPGQPVPTELPGTFADRSGDPGKGLLAVVFQYNPTYDGGSVQANIALTSGVPAEFRIVSEERQPRPGYLVDKAFPNDGTDPAGKTYTTFPVTQLGPDDSEVVYLGLGSGAETYQGMRTYQVFPIVERGKITGVRGSYEGPSTLTPPLPMRDG